MKSFFVGMNWKETYFRMKEPNSREEIKFGETVSDWFFMAETLPELLKSISEVFRNHDEAKCFLSSLQANENDGEFIGSCLCAGIDDRWRRGWRPVTKEEIQAWQNGDIEVSQIWRTEFSLDIHKIVDYKRQNICDEDINKAIQSL